MSCRWKHDVPHDDDVCLDCIVLNVTGEEEEGERIVVVNKCVMHGPHGEHELGILNRERNCHMVGMWWCETCGVWLADE